MKFNQIISSPASFFQHQPPFDAYRLFLLFLEWNTYQPLSRRVPLFTFHIWNETPVTSINSKETRTAIPSLLGMKLMHDPLKPSVTGQETSRTTKGIKRACTPQTMPTCSRISSYTGAATSLHSATAQTYLLFNRIDITS